MEFFFFFFPPKQLLLAQENLTLHWRSRQCHQYLGVIVNLSPSWVSEWKSLSCVQLSCDTTQLCPHGLYSPWNSPGQKTGVGSFFLLQGIFPTLGSEPRSPALQVDSLPAEPPGKPKNTGVDSLSLLQRVFSNQESNQGILHCRRILYHLNYQEFGKTKKSLDFSL